MDSAVGRGKDLAPLGSALSWDPQGSHHPPLQGLPAQQGDRPLAGSGVDGTASHRESDPKRRRAVTLLVDFPARGQQTKNPKHSPWPLTG